MTAPWWAGLPPAESQISCGTGQHVLRWADGQLTAADHADAEGELVLAALGGDKSECVALVEAWGAHAGDLDVLALGPRSPADQLAVTWDLVRSLRSVISPQPGLPPGRPAAWAAALRAAPAEVAADAPGVPRTAPGPGPPGRADGPVRPGPRLPVRAVRHGSRRLVGQARPRDGTWPRPSPR